MGLVDMKASDLETKALYLIHNFFSHLKERKFEGQMKHDPE